MMRALDEARLPRPAVLLLTHAHADHSGGAAALTEACGCRVLAGARTASIVASGDEARLSLDRARAAGIYPDGYRYRSCPTVEPIAGGEDLLFGSVRVRRLDTPGHSADHGSYLVTTDSWRALVVGDALFEGGKVVLQDTWDCSVPDTCATVRALAREDFGLFLPGHGPFALHHGTRHVATAMERLDRLLCPALYL